jgi:glycosyltransferase involved in cell wall biosynthesis
MELQKGSFWPGNMQKIRLLQIVDSLHQGGMENIMVQVCNHLDPERFEITVCCLSRTGPFAERLREGIELVSLEKPPGFSFGAVKALGNLIRKGNFDLIHTHHLGGLIYTALARPKPAASRPLIIHSEHIILHGDELSPRRIFQRKLLYRLASCVFTVSSQQLEQLHSLGLTHQCQFTLRNGVDGVRFHPLPRGERAAHRQQLGLDPDRFWIGKVARFAALKRHQPLIEGFEIAARENPEIGLLLLGDGGSEKDTVLARIDSSPVRDRIIWVGLQQDPVPWYQAMDLLAIASESEGMPNAALEAMACGVPVLANEVCGVREVAGDGSHSWIEDLGSSELIAATLSRISALPPAELTSAGESARRYSEIELSLDAMIERYRQLYSGETFQNLSLPSC